MVIIMFLVGFVFLIKGGDWFVEAAAGIARRFRVPEVLIGATIVSIGTTLPEVMVSASSALGGHGEISYGNAIGSVICNTALIAALSIAVKPVKIDGQTLKIPVAFFFFAAAVYLLTAYTSGHFGRPAGFVLLSVFFVYMAFTIAKAKKQTTHSHPLPMDNEKKGAYKEGLLLIFGAVLIAVGANLLIHNGILIAQTMGVPESVIALTFVAIGTSLPELVTAVTSLVKGHGALSLGNIIGANLFNLVLVSGLSAVLAPFDIPQSMSFAGKNASLLIDLPVMLLVMAVLTLPVLKRGKLFRAQGIILLLIYAAFCILQFSAA